MRIDNLEDSKEFIENFIDFAQAINGEAIFFFERKLDIGTTLMFIRFADGLWQFGNYIDPRRDDVFYTADYIAQLVLKYRDDINATLNKGE